MTNVADNTDDRLPRYLLPTRDHRADPLANRIFTGPKARCHCFINHYETRAVGHILFGHHATGEQRYPHRLKISGAGAAKIDLRTLTRRHLATFDRQERRDVIQRTHQWQARDETYGSNFRRAK